MKIVNENISGFKKQGDPKQGLDVGKESTYEKEQVLKRLADKGVRFNIDWDQDRDTEKVKNRVKILEDIFKVEEFIEKLVTTSDVAYEDIEVAHPGSISVKMYKIYDGNSVMFRVLNQKDANIIVNILNSMSPRHYDTYKYEKDDSFFNNYVYVNELNDNMLDGIVDVRKFLSQKF